MKSTTQTLQINRVPAKATVSNIATILHTMDVFDRKADKAHTRGDFNKATRYSNYVAELDALVAVYTGKLPESEF